MGETGIAAVFGLVDKEEEEEEEEGEPERARHCLEAVW